VTPGLVAALVPMLTATVAGVLMLRARVAVLAAALLIAAGAAGLLALVLDRAGAATAAVTAAVAALVALLPAALWAYPRPRWRHPVDFVLAVLVVAPGVGATLWPTEQVVFLMAVCTTAALVAQGWWRLEIEVEPWRAALVWSSLSSAVVAVLVWTALFVWEDAAWAPAAALVAVAVIPASMAVGVLRPQVLDARALVVHTAVALVLTIGYVAAFVGTLATLELMGTTQVRPVALALLGFALAVGVHPASRWLRAALDQMLFGDRPDPLEAAHTVVARLGDDPRDALEVVRRALAFPYLAVVRDDAPLLESGAPVPHRREMVLDASADPGTTLVVGLRPGDLSVNEGDARVLALVVPLVVQLLHAENLAERLQASRRLAVETIADERRRLRRDLHDGLGPTLTGIAFATDAARNTLRTDPDGAAELLAGIRADTAGAIDQIRALVYNMRPPALDELGLVPALRQQALTLGRAEGTSLVVTFQGAETLPVLPAALEVAVYRIVLEALLNVARHSTAASAEVTFSFADETLRVDIEDDGGPRRAWAPGVGIASMRERAAELGGTLSAGPTSRGGAVHALLPRSPA
jgi:signal transduction histidine kinase